MQPEDILGHALTWLPVVVIVLSVVNAFTDHYSKHRSVIKALMHATELLSVLSSKDAGRLPKLPLTDKKPPSDLDRRVREIMGK